MDYLISFLEGIITFISPCLLPMLPVYISYFAGQEEDRQKGKALVNALGFVFGFTLVFITLGAFAGTVGVYIKQHTTAVNIVLGVIMILFGLNFMEVLRLPFLNRSGGVSANFRPAGFFPSALFGIIFSISWTPCVGAFLGSALMLAASQGGSGKGIIMLLSYSLGLGIPFVLSAILIDRLKSTIGFIKKHYRAVKMISGGFLVLIGILMATGLLGRFLALLTF